MAVAAHGRAACGSPTPRGSPTCSSSTDSGDAPLLADHPEVPAEVALQGFDGGARLRVRARRERRDARGGPRVPPRRRPTGRRAASGRAALRTPRPRRRPSPGAMGAGTVHHVAWASTIDDHEAWRERVAEAGAQPDARSSTASTSSSIYFREPSGVLFEIATDRPGLHRRRAARDARRAPVAAAEVRAAARPGRRPCSTPLPNPRPVTSR